MKDRHFYIDWIRIFLICSVFLFHVGMIFNNWGWHIKNDIRLEALTPVMHFLHAWRMPLLFLVSGAGTRFALGIRSNGQYAAERTKRLFIPLLAGMLILVPVQVYIEKITQFSSLFNFYLHLFEGVYPTGNFSWHHLWYLVYLFFISMIFIPFIAFFRSPRYAAFERGVEKLASLKGGLLLLYLPLIGSQVLLRPYFPHETHAFINDWAFICLDFLYFLFGFVLLGNPRVVGLIVRDRMIWLGTTLVASGIMFSIMYVYYSTAGAWLVFDILALLVSWSIGLTILAYAKKFANIDNLWRKQLNTAIYPFYLLHQPILVVVAYFVVPFSVSLGMKALLITALTLAFFLLVYSFLVIPFNSMRLIFGMKKKEKKQTLVRAVV
ncbi:MAG TPA: acyltransferase [Prolixibacteraceae bacterium]|nr:acyltransferase [Prolixibacteraceae bacterium]